MSDESRPLVYVVDDEPDLRALARYVLETQRFRVVEAEDGAVALAQFPLVRPDLVMLDVMMPRVDGFSVCAELRRRPESEHVPVLMLTGLDDERSIHRAYDAGATDFAVKPLQWALLGHRLRFLLRAARTQEELRFLADHDALTRLPNRRRVSDWLARSLERGGQGCLLAVLAVEVEQFDAVRETLGHHAGDELLCRVADRLRKSLDRTDVGVRSGGCEPGALLGRLRGGVFAVGLVGLDRAGGAAHVAERLLADLQDEPVALDAEEVAVTAHLGVAVSPRDGIDPETLLANASAAMRQCRRSAPGSFQFFDREVQECAVRRSALEASLRPALDRGEMSLFYQPAVDANRRPVGFEALLRWHHPGRGLVLPDEFVPVLEETGMIVRLGEWVLREACARIVALRRSTGREATLAVNVSARQLRQAGFAAFVERVLDETGLPARALAIEITESVLLDERTEAGAELLALDRLGVRIVLDDFGTGFSSLAYLSRHPVHAVKIDRSFVQGLPGCARSAAIVTAILAMARGLGLVVVAEGVETAAQEVFLRERGCDFQQGFLFGAPEPEPRLDRA